jgi:outer membrane protein OmpA-like peptidoglycan-associated protein
MTRAPGLWVASGLAVMVLLPACAGQETRGAANGVEKVIENARRNGAYTCAPKELALAEAHLQRTRDELGLGNLLPARDHLRVSDENAKLAFQKSPPEKCAPKVVVAPPPKVVAQDLDPDKDGILNPQDKCPYEPEDKDGWQDEDGCPDPDNDNDGIADATDKCLNEPEDFDGFEDDDGCPDGDNDKDTVVDLKDKCPNEAGPPDNDGCPQKYKLVVVTDQKIELKQTVYFATAKTRILPKSFALLDEVGQVLKDRPTINVRIEGHTDSRGNDDYNLKLSQGRASSVRTYLIGKGIASERMEAIGYGETRPIAANSTRVGRAQNRRVEFFITKQ